MNFDQTTFRLTNVNGFVRNLFVAGAVALAISAVGMFTDARQFFFSYLNAYVFWVSLGLGALFFVMLNHLTGSVWMIVLRRISESVMMALPYMAILFIPILFGMNHLYHWSLPEAASDAILQKKSGYLNIPFFIIRSTIYFGLWFAIARKLYKTSLEQDGKSLPQQIASMRKVSAPGMVIFAVTISFAAFDWLMSLDAHWYSTIYGLYFFSGAFLSALAFLVLMPLFLQKKGALDQTISIEHYSDLAKLLFGFTIFWGYMAFSQYFLIWYANIPEETIFFQHRWEGSWKVFSLFLPLGNFLVPFIGLMTRAAKRRIGFLQFIAIWILIAHWIDLYWNIMPNLHHHGIHFSWLDVTLFISIGAIFLGIFFRHLFSQALIPIGDPKLQDSIHFGKH